MVSEPLRISVIIAAYNVENFIEAAVQSALDQTVPFHEIIVVNDCSTDRTGQLITRLAQYDARDDEFPSDKSRLVLIHNAQNKGLGPVRNIGTAAATGDYICYLDGDDLFTPHAHATMQKVVANHPDVAIFNHARLYDSGHLAPNYNTSLLAPATHTTIAARKALFTNLNVAWNKVYARAFLDRTGLQFPAGKYEDIGWNFLTLMQARDIVTTQEIVVHYRQRDGSILRTRNTTHFDIFDRWAELFDALKDQRDLMDTYGATLRTIRFKSLRTVLENKMRLPKRAKPAFARRIVAVCGPIKDLPAGEIGRIERLLDLPGGYWLRAPFRSDAYMALRKLALLTYRKFRGGLKPFVARHVFARLPLDRNLVVYQSYWGAKIACNPYAIFQQLRKTAPDRFRHAWVVKDGVDLRDTQGVATHLREHSWAYYYTLARAGTLITNTNFPNEVTKRAGATHLQTKHGTPLKYMGLDQHKTDDKAFADINAFVRRCQRWDYVISSNSYSTRVWRQGFPYSYDVLETGYPRNDRLVLAQDADVAHVRAQLNLPADKQVVLYAPTFRPVYAGITDTQPSKEAIIASIIAGLAPDQVLAIRDHYFLGKDSRFANDPRVINLSDHVSTTDVLLATDVLITDYSSIMFDFAVLQRPIVVLAYDKALYQKTRGTYFDIAALHPGTYCATLDALTHALSVRSYDTDAARAQARDFHANFCHLDDGHASRRITQRLFPDLARPQTQEDT